MSSASSTDAAKAWKLQASNDGTTFTDIHTVASHTFGALGELAEFASLYTYDSTQGVVTTLVNTGISYCEKMSVSPDGSVLLVADSILHVILKIVIGDGSSLVTPTDFVGTSGTSGTADGTGTAATFNQPRDVAFLPDGTAVFITDGYNGAIRKATYPGGVVSAAPRFGPLFASFIGTRDLVAPMHDPTALTALSSTAHRSPRSSHPWV